MLQPFYLHHHIRTTTSVEVLLEDLVGEGLPLLNPSVTLINRTPISDPSSFTVTILRDFEFSEQSDPDFNGTSTTTLQAVTTIGVPGSIVIDDRVLGKTLIPTADAGMSTRLQVGNAGPGAEVLVSLIVQGWVDSSIHGDEMLITRG